MRNATLFALGFVCVMALALGAAAETTGVLIDSMCAGKVGSDATKLAGHKVSCAVSCKDSGFAVVADGKVLKLDDAGDAKALAVLQKTSKANNVKVKVKGHVDGDTIHVESVQEVE